MRVLALFGFLLVSSIGFGQVSFKASASKAKVNIDQTFQIFFKVENADAQNFQAPKLSDFNVLGGPNQSNSMSLVNGKMARSVTFSYYLQPKKEGKFTIDGAKINANGTQLTSNKITIEVGTGNGGKGGQQGSGQAKSINDQIAERIFLRLILDKTEAFVGEQITATYKVYVEDLNINNMEMVDMPMFTGFWTQDIETGSNGQFTVENYKGKRYKTIVVKKVALFPQRAGDLNLEPMKLQTYVRVRVNNGRSGFFGDFFGNYQNVAHQFGTRNKVVTIKPLPRANKPSDFTGAVGAFKLTPSIDKTETSVDDPITLKMKLSGTGNIKMINVPEIDLPKDFEVFEPKVKSSISEKSTYVNGYQQYDYLIIPRRPGEFKLPSVGLSYFDPKKEQYISLKTPEYLIKVDGEASTVNTPAVSNITKEEIELLGEDIRFIHTDAPDLRKSGEFLLSSWTFGGLMGTPFLLFAFLALLKRKNDSENSDVVAVKRKKAGKLAGKRLAAAKKHLDQQEEKPFYDELSKALWGYLGDKLDISSAQLSKEGVTKALISSRVDKSTIDELFLIIDDCQMALFAPTASGSMEKTYQKANSLINKLEEGLS